MQISNVATSKDALLWPYYRQVAGSRRSVLYAVQSTASPNWQQQQEQHWEDGLHVGPRREAEDAEDAQLQHLTAGEDVDLSLRHPADVVVRRVCHLRGDSGVRTGGRGVNQYW